MNRQLHETRIWRKLRNLCSFRCINMETTSSQGSQDEGRDDENTMTILIATDNHIGHLEKDPERGKDALVTFEEILQIAQAKNVDFILLGGDLFHENKPSRNVVHKTMELFRKYCMGDKPCFLEFLSDQSINFAANSFPTVNYEDSNYNISIPVFSIHGNHDDPAGDGNLCTLNLLSVNGLVNYFGKATNVDDVTVNPLLIQKGGTKLALFGLGAVRDERLHRTFVNKKVKMLRPKEDPDSWFNCFVFHQNRAKHGPKNYIPEQFLDEFLDLVIWGHEHECLIDPQWSESEKDFFICQPGSSVATSLCEGEAKQKYIGILKIKGKDFRIDKVPLKTVRLFYTKDVTLSETDLEPTDDQGVQEYLAQQVEELIQRSEGEHSGDKRQPKLPLIRIRVEYSGGFSIFNVNRFGQQFVKRVANTKDIVKFFRKKAPFVRGRTTDDGATLRIRPEILDDVQMEDLINEFLNSDENKIQLNLLSQHKMGLALKEFVEKDEKEAIVAIVKLQLLDTQKVLTGRNIRDDDIMQEVIRETERSRTEELSQEDQTKTRKLLEQAVRESQSRSKQDLDSGGSDEETGEERNKTSRGRGRGRGRGKGSAQSRGRGSRTATKTRDTSWITTTNTKDTSRASSKSSGQGVITIDDDDDDMPSSHRNSSRTFSRARDESDEEDPFAFPSKRHRR